MLFTGASEDRARLKRLAGASVQGIPQTCVQTQLSDLAITLSPLNLEPQLCSRDAGLSLLRTAQDRTTATKCSAECQKQCKGCECTSCLLLGSSSRGTIWGFTPKNPLAGASLLQRGQFGRLRTFRQLIVLRMECSCVLCRPSDTDAKSRSWPPRETLALPLREDLCLVPAATALQNSQSQGMAGDVPMAGPEAVPNLGQWFLEPPLREA